MMTLGFIGLGKMGQNMVTRLLEQGVDVVVYNRTKETLDNFKFQISNFKFENQPGKLTAAYTLSEMIKNLSAPRVIWLMVSAGQPVDEVLDELVGAGLTPGDAVIDGGNSYYKDSVRRHDALKTKGINYIDCGTSGGLVGGKNGACLMLGGDREIVDSLNWLWQALAAPGGYTYFGTSGAGHFVKMVHNGIEYGMDQALGEGFEILRQGPYKLNLATVADNWTHGSVIRGFLIELLAKALAADPELKSFTGKVGGGQTGQWSLETAKELGIEAEVIEEAVEARAKSQTQPTFATKVVSALRKGYGGHEEKT